VTQLKFTLIMIRELDQLKHYDRRNQFIYEAVFMAIVCGLSAGFRFDPKEPEWPVAFIELPTGQVSWHVPQHTRVWDGHTTEQKYKRLKEFTGG
jgi:hypothetical protein